MRKICLFLLCLMLVRPAVADDSAASIGAGGLVVLKNEKRIAMSKEVLSISLSKVHVDYEFRNDTADNVTTMVAFPIPAYEFSEDMMHSIAESGFDDFKLTIEGKPTTFSVEALAKVNGKDVSQILKADGIDIASFGHYDVNTDVSADFTKLSAAQTAALVKAGLIDTNAGEPNAGTGSFPLYTHADWSVEKKYYWTQTFPAHSTVHISHEYTPAVGYNMIDKAAFVASGPNPTAAQLKAQGVDDPDLQEIKSVCVDESLRQQLINMPPGPDNGTYRRIYYVDFILTTANTWKQPINDFTLLVNRPDKTETYGNANMISFCWPGPVTKVSADQFKATATDLIPKSEVRIGYFAQ